MSLWHTRQTQDIWEQICETIAGCPMVPLIPSLPAQRVHSRIQTLVLLSSQPRLSTPGWDNKPDLQLQTQPSCAPGKGCEGTKPA